VAEADALHDPVSLSVARVCAAFVFLWVGNLPEAEAIIEQLASDAETHSLTPYQTMAQGLLGGLAIRRGDATAAVVLLLDCLETMRKRHYEVFASVIGGDLAKH